MFYAMIEPVKGMLKSVDPSVSAWNRAIARIQGFIYVTGINRLLMLILQNFYRLVSAEGI